MVCGAEWVRDWLFILLRWSKWWWMRCTHRFVMATTNYSSVRPHLKNRSNNTSNRGKWCFWPIGLTWHPLDNEHSFLLWWCYWCTYINDANLKQRHFIAILLPPSSGACLPNAEKYHSGTGWLPSNIFVSHASSPICTPYLHDFYMSFTLHFNSRWQFNLSSTSGKVGVPTKYV